MSLIIEALKKAEEASQGGSSQSPPPGRRAPRRPSRKNLDSSGQFKLLGWAVFGLLLAFLFGMVLSRARKGPQEPLETAASRDTKPMSKPSPAPTPESPPEPALRSTPGPRLVSTPGKPLPEEAKPAPSPAPVPSSPPPPQPTKRPETVSDADHWLNELTRRAIEQWKEEKTTQAQDREEPVRIPPPSKETVRLQLILWDEDNPSAMINGNIVREGDELDGWTVREITKSHVSMERDGQRYVLRF